ncbi:hypothetical protein NCAS_0F01940 [Naumovozyma castellii]|uniref:histone acetyltransferase n=1 Tax=Naumovozyma castellii TaxID=27288 RepID=G0VGQ7_NAUCA|nr:hypothetical protein NCAS_0F01940 [Naumovozyma castellii CBS 4309]CCC70678.1 hypothetical protein NCAS_0F01940 [Naumovozyma castellii CBS 4309]
MESRRVSKKRLGLHEKTSKNVAKRRKGKGKGKDDSNTSDENLYGILNERNIKDVQFGMDKRFLTWYGSNVYFDNETEQLGIKDNGNSNTDSKDKQSTDVHSLTGKTRFWLDTLFVCEYCFKYSENEENFRLHAERCRHKHSAPGRIKYKSPQYTIRRVRGYKHTLFCQCLCLFTKLFLDNKSMYFKVNHYDFYILYETTTDLSMKNKPLGFFSKDLVSYDQNNLACILIFPPYQRRRLGSLLIEFSYKLSKLDDIISGPELPLSPFGLIGYLKYWSQIISWELTEGELCDFDSVTLEDISKVTGLRINDIIMTLKHLECIGEENRIYLDKLRRWLKTHERTFMIEDQYLLLDD